MEPVQGAVRNGKGEELPVDGQGIPLSRLLEQAGVGEYSTVTVTADDAYSAGVTAAETAESGRVYLLLEEDGSLRLVVFGDKNSNSAYDYIKTGVDLVLDHPEYYYNYNLWEFEWDKTQTWKLTGQSGVPMQRLLIAVPGEPDEESVRLTVKKLEAGTNKPLAGVSFKIESADGSGDFSVTRQTGADGTLTLTKEADNLTAGQHTITEEAVPEGYVAQTASQTVTVMPNDSISNTFVFYNHGRRTTSGAVRN